MVTVVLKNAVSVHQLTTTNALGVSMTEDWADDCLSYPKHLTCRQALEVECRGSLLRLCKGGETVLRRLRGHEASRAAGIPDGLIRVEWRGDITIEDVQGRYMVFDAFLGAGGVSRGAADAGFAVKGAVDKDLSVWESYAANFPDVELFWMPIDQLVLLYLPREMKVDVLYFSLPCQYFLLAYTVPLEHDDTNIFALYGCNELLARLCP